MKRYSSFREFYPFYLSQHTNVVCRYLHIVGTLLGLAVTASGMATGALWLVLFGPVVGYGFSWTGHFFFEKNRPATFDWPWYSFLGDWMMVWETMTRSSSVKPGSSKDTH